VSVTLTYEEGTIRLAGDVPEDLPGVERDDRSKTARAPAYRYAAIRDALAECGVPVDDGALDLPPLTLESSYELREYQRTALDAWRGADERGVLELPTGSGKAPSSASRRWKRWGRRRSSSSRPSTCWSSGSGNWRRSSTAHQPPRRRRTTRVEDVTVSTYDSAYLRADELGDRFGFVVFDEVHHLGGEGYRDVARLLAAPARLGRRRRRSSDRTTPTRLSPTLIGPVVHRLSVDDLAGDHLAEYDVKRVEVSLTDAEREVYEDHQSTFTDYLARSGIRMRSGSDYQELVKRSGSDPRGREALLAKQRAREVMMNADRKVEELADILDRHSHDRIIVFTAHTDLVYRLSERFLLPAITHETSAAERREILERFREGSYSRVVTANVLDEGVDVPDANVAVVLSGSGSEREFTQRLGRILRPKEGRCLRVGRLEGSRDDGVVPRWAGAPLRTGERGDRRRERGGASPLTTVQGRQIPVRLGAGGRGSSASVGSRGVFRQGEPERRSLPGSGVDPDVAVVALDDPFTQRQPDAGSRVIVGRVEALEHLEDAFAVRPRNADPSSRTEKTYPAPSRSTETSIRAVPRRCTRWRCPAGSGTAGATVLGRPGLVVTPPP